MQAVRLTECSGQLLPQPLMAPINNRSIPLPILQALL